MDRCVDMTQYKHKNNKYYTLTFKYYYIDNISLSLSLTHTHTHTHIYIYIYPTILSPRWVHPRFTEVITYPTSYLVCKTACTMHAHGFALLAFYDLAKVSNLVPYQEPGPKNQNHVSSSWHMSTPNKKTPTPKVEKLALWLLMEKASSKIQIQPELLAKSLHIWCHWFGCSNV